jgi:hypothetical protein
MKQITVTNRRKKTLVSGTNHDYKRWNRNLAFAERILTRVEQNISSQNK